MDYKNLPCGCHRVSSNGHIYSRWNSKRWKRTKGTLKKHIGYYQFKLHGTIFLVHRLIAASFIQNPLGYSEVRHKNDVRTDNRISNLAWGNQKMNGEDKVRNGHSLQGEKHPNSKLKEKEVIEIRRKLETGHSLQVTANNYGVSKKLVLMIKNRQIWKHI